MNSKTDALQLQMPLSELVAGLVRSSETLSQLETVTVTGVQLDSRLLRPGDLFIALFGRNHDAREFIPQALKVGVSAILVEAGDAAAGVGEVGGVPLLAIEGLAGKASALAGRFYREPSARARVIGITGTNGKTSCAMFLAQAAARLGADSATLGTLGYGRVGQLATTALTTPDPVFTQRALAELLASGADPIVMEVSSVGLHQKRVSGVRFDTAVFTNLTRDHLDYHGTMEAYGSNKKKLFTMPGLRRAVINLDDPYGLSILNELAPSVALMTYAREHPEADVYARSSRMDAQGMVIDLSTPVGAGEVRVALLGSFNVSNLLAVAATLVASASAEGQEPLLFADLATALEALEPVPGRMQRVHPSQGVSDVSVVVDYAHTPDALRSVLGAMREHFDGSLCCVFGAGGNRDAGKRPLMAEAVEAQADRIILTDDNPRGESGDLIIEQIASGLTAPRAALRQRDRGLAIATAIMDAEPGEVILIAGKGHENYQEVAGVRQAFDDVEHARAALDARLASRAKGEAL